MVGKGQKDGKLFEKVKFSGWKAFERSLNNFWPDLHQPVRTMANLQRDFKIIERIVGKFGGKRRFGRQKLA